MVIDDLYYGDNCSCCAGHFHNEAAHSFAINSEVLQEYLRTIYKGFDTSDAIEPTMWRAVLKVLNEATVEGLSRSNTDTHDRKFLASLRHSNEVFAAFKVHSMGEKMAEKLLNDKGKLKPFREWKEDVKGIASHYVGSWLETEYNTAVIRTHNAADWQQFERDADIMPNLRWMPTTSPHPESSHKKFWERQLTLPVSDPFWDKHHPGDRWNCKCSLEQTDEPATPELKEEFRGEKPQRGLANNPGKDGRMFSQDHPYFPKSCSKCSFNKGLMNRLRTFFRNGEKDCYNCQFLEGCLLGKKKVQIQKEEQQKAIANIKEIKETIDPYNGKTISGDNFITGSLTFLRRSLKDIYEHNKEDIILMKWLQKLNLDEVDKIKTWKYEGWAENRPYDSTHPKYDPNEPNKKKHKETKYFTYYSFKIKNKTFWANVKVHINYDKEILYTIENKQPYDIELGEHP